MTSARFGIVLIAISISLAFSLAAADSSFSPAVRATGQLIVPDGYEMWPLLGTWSIAAKQEKGAEGLHYVYTQPGTIEHFRQHGTFPDGAVLVKELRGATTRAMSTGTVSLSGPIQGWFVMVKDTEGRFPDSPLWGNGWGWAYFEADSRMETTTKRFGTECLTCHVPAKATDWVFTEAYPILQR